MTIPYIDSTSSYIYSKVTDFSGGLSPACLDKEIRDVFDITDPFIGVFFEEGDDRVVLAFYNPLSSGEQTTLDSIVSNHDPDCNLGGDQPVFIQGDPPEDGSTLVYDSTSGTWITEVSELGLNSPQDFWASLGLDRAASDGISSTTSAVYQNKTSLTITNDTDEDQIWRIGYTAEFNAASNNKSVEVEMYETVLAAQYANSLQQTNSSTNWFVFAGFHIESIPAGATRTFQINFRRVVATTCSIRNTEIEAWRVV